MHLAHVWDIFWLPVTTMNMKVVKIIFLNRSHLLICPRPMKNQFRFNDVVIASSRRDYYSCNFDLNPSTTSHVTTDKNVMASMSTVSCGGQNPAVGECQGLPHPKCKVPREWGHQGRWDPGGAQAGAGGDARGWLWCCCHSWPDRWHVTGTWKSGSRFRMFYISKKTLQNANHMNQKKSYY